MIGEQVLLYRPASRSVLLRVLSGFNNHNVTDHTVMDFHGSSFELLVECALAGSRTKCHFEPLSA
jgi:hypothetical protein